MSSNYIRLLNCNKSEMELFIRSIVTKEASAYVDWHAWMSSEDPEVTYIGQAAHYKDEDGAGHPCRILKETEEDGKIIRHIFIVEAKGKVTRMSLPKERVIAPGEEDTRTEISDSEIDDILAAIEEAAALEEEQEALDIAESIVQDLEMEQTMEDLDASLEALKKHASSYSSYDPDNPEDAELPTIAFRAMKDWE